MRTEDGSRLRVYEVPVSYDGRTYDEGKKIRGRDGVWALLCIARYGFAGVNANDPRVAVLRIRSVPIRRLGFTTQLTIHGQPSPSDKTPHSGGRSALSTMRVSCLCVMAYVFFILFAYASLNRPILCVF